MRRQLVQRALLIHRALLGTVSIATLTVGGFVIWAGDAAADDVVPGSVIARPAFEETVGDDEPTGSRHEGCVFCDQAASAGECTRCDRAVARPLAPLGGWLDPADDNDFLLLPLVPPAQTAGPGLTLPAPWWSQLPTPSVRSAKTLLVSDLSATGPALSSAPSFESSIEFTSSCQLAPSCQSSACQSGNCQHAAFEYVAGDDLACELTSASDDASICAGQICAGEVCTRAIHAGRSCAECAARSACTTQECTGQNRTAKNCESSQCAPEAVAADSSIEQPVAEIIEIIDSLGESVVSGTLFDGDIVCTDSAACRADGSCTHDDQCVVGDGSCPTTRAALIAELRNLAAAEAAACDFAANASDSSADAGDGYATAWDTEATACEPAATGCGFENRVLSGLTAQAAACESSGRPVSVLTVQNPYVGQSVETPVNVMSHRQAASRVDATADTLEADGLYEAADMLRQIADELRLKAREQALSAVSRAVPPHPVPYPPVYRDVPSFAPPLPVAPEAYQPTGQWSLPALEAYRLPQAVEQPPVR